MPGGRLYLVPNLLGVIAPEAVLPAHTIAIARDLRHLVVENAKAARAFLKTIGTTTAIQSIAITEIGERTTPADIERMLGPALAGGDVGLVSDAGCPAVADPGAQLVAAAHRAGLRVVPLVGPSALLLALMASGMNGQGFSFHGYLPAKAEQRVAALRQVEALARKTGATQMFIETPYRNVAMLESLVSACDPGTLLAVAADLTLATEEIVMSPLAQWRGRDLQRYQNRPVIFLLGRAQSY